MFATGRRPVTSAVGVVLTKGCGSASLMPPRLSRRGLERRLWRQPQVRDDLLDHGARKVGRDEFSQPGSGRSPVTAYPRLRHRGRDASVRTDDRRWRTRHPLLHAYPSALSPDVCKALKLVCRTRSAAGHGRPTGQGRRRARWLARAAASPDSQVLRWRASRPIAASPSSTSAGVPGSGTGKVTLLKVEATAALLKAVDVKPW
jgi:hypothetical protein